MSNRLEKRVAIVTGGAQGIGRAIAECLTKAGAKVVIGDRQKPENCDLDWHTLDVSNETSVKTFTQHVVNTVGPPSILVNNAGILTEAPVIEQTVEEWDRVMAVNLRGPFLLAKHVVPHMVAANKPTIINIGSIEGISGNPNHSAYMASKAGVHGLTTSLAIDLGQKGIRVNAIAPGWINTEINKIYIDGLPDQDEVIRQLSNLHPLGHIGDPTDIGDVAVWLASDESRFVTGQVIQVEGGRMSKLSLPPIFNQ